MPKDAGAPPVVTAPTAPAAGAPAAPPAPAPVADHLGVLPKKDVAAPPPAPAPDADKAKAEADAAAAKVKADADAAAKAASDKAASDKKADDDKKAADEKKKAEDAAKAKGESEKFDLKAPDGSALDQASHDEVVAFAKANGLSSAQAQAVLKREHERQEAGLKASLADMDVKNQAWGKELLADPDFGGGKDAQFAENCERVHRVLKYADPTGELVQGVEAAKMTHWKPFAKAMLKLGNLIKEDSMGAPAAPGKVGRKSDADVLYPTAAAPENT